MAFSVKVQSSPCSQIRHHVVLSHGAKRNRTQRSWLSATTLNECTGLHLQPKISKQAPSLELANVTGSHSRWSQGRTQNGTTMQLFVDSKLALWRSFEAHSKRHGNNHNLGMLTVPLREEIAAGGYARLGNLFVALFFMLQSKFQTKRQTTHQSMRQAFDLISKLGLLKHEFIHEVLLVSVMTSMGLYYGSYYVMRGCSVHDQLHSEYIQHLYAAIMVQTLISTGIAV